MMKLIIFMLLMHLMLASAVDVPFNCTKIWQTKRSNATLTCERLPWQCWYDAMDCDSQKRLFWANQECDKPETGIFRAQCVRWNFTLTFVPKPFSRSHEHCGTGDEQGSYNGSWLGNCTFVPGLQDQSEWDWEKDMREQMPKYAAHRSSRVKNTELAQWPIRMLWYCLELKSLIDTVSDFISCTASTIWDSLKRLIYTVCDLISCTASRIWEFVKKNSFYLNEVRILLAFGLFHTLDTHMRQQYVKIEVIRAVQVALFMLALAPWPGLGHTVWGCSFIFVLMLIPLWHFRVRDEFKGKYGLWEEYKYDWNLRPCQCVLPLFMRMLEGSDVTSEDQCLGVSRLTLFPPRSE